MKQNHISLAAGFLPGISLLIILVCRRAVQSGQSLPEWVDHIPAGWLWVAAEAIAFFLPIGALLFMLGRKKESKFDLKFRGFSHGAIPMLLTLAVTMALINLILGDLLAGLAGREYSEVQVFASLLESNASVLALFLAIVLIPAVGGQLLFGDALLCAYAPCGGVPALILCALGYGLLTGTPITLPGTFISMLAFIYAGWTLNSVWASIFAHCAYGMVHLLLLFIAQAYSGQELWSVVRLVVIFLMGLFLYLSMHSMEHLMEKGVMRRLESTHRERILNDIVFSPGLWMTLFLFVINWIT